MGWVCLKEAYPLAKAADFLATGWILSKFFIEKAFSEEAKHFGDRIVSDIKVQFIKKLGGAEWMSKSVRDLSIEKGGCPLLIPSSSTPSYLPRQEGNTPAYNPRTSPQHYTKNWLSHEEPRHTRLCCPGRILCRCQHYQHSLFRKRTFYCQVHRKAPMVCSG